MNPKSRSEQWDTPVEDWRDYILSVWRGDGRVEELKGDDSILKAILARCTEAFQARKIPTARVRVWANVQMPVEGDGYDEGYPHVHQNDLATTLVHYLDEGDEPAPLHIFDGDEVVEIHFPVAGKTIYMTNGTKHGVLKNHGTRPRVAIISTAYP